MIPSRSELPDGGGEAEELVLARARARARSAWSASLREDDLTRRAASEERLIAAWPRPRPRPARAFTLGAAVAACVAAALFLAFGSFSSSSSSSSSSERADHSSSRAAPASAGVPSALASAASATSTPEVTGPPPSAIVVTGACASCQLDGSAVEPGARLGHGRLSVPRGASVTIGFAIRGALASSLVDPASGIDVQGPAVASAPDDRTISLERGTARFRGLRDVAVILPGGRLVGEGATFTVTIDARGGSHIAVEKGSVVVTSHATNKATSASAGTAFDLAPSEAPALRAAPPAAASTAMVDPAERGAPAPALAAAPAPAPAPPAGEAAETREAVEEARARFHGGEVTAARAQLESLARARDANVARRASFTLAEIEMASGDRDSGRARLAELVAGPDVKLASDAATLLARSEPTASARADAWSRYLATSPPTAHRHRALLERAEALLDAGRVGEANAILGELGGASLSDAQQRHLERLTIKAKERR